MSQETDEKSLDLDFVDRCVSQIGTAQAQTLAHLQALQKEYGYLPPQALKRLSEVTGRPLDEAGLLGIAHVYEQSAGWHKRIPVS